MLLYLGLRWHSDAWTNEYASECNSAKRRLRVLKIVRVCRPSCEDFRLVWRTNISRLIQLRSISPAEDTNRTNRFHRYSLAGLRLNHCSISNGSWYLCHLPTCKIDLFSDWLLLMLICNALRVNSTRCRPSKMHLRVNCSNYRTFLDVALTLNCRQLGLQTTLKCDAIRESNAGYGPMWFRGIEVKYLERRSISAIWYYYVKDEFFTRMHIRVMKSKVNTKLVC